MNPISVNTNLYHDFRDAGFFFEEKRSDAAGMPRSPAAEDQDAADGLEVLRGEIEIFEFDGPEIFNESVMQGLFEGLWLFEDFLEHKMLKISFRTDVIFEA